jgi:phosphoribosyl 1,2-cyclic phosphodiesterase
MIIRCWGSRGSIPVSGRGYLRYGGNTTCLEIRTTDDQIVIVDAGSGIREAGNALTANRHHHLTLLLTHAHWDHIMGFPFFKPIYSNRTMLTIRGHSFTRESLKEMFSRIMSSPNFPVTYLQIRAQIAYQENGLSPYRLGALTVTPIALSHPNQGMGYKFEENGKTFVFLTDNELGYKHEGGLDFQDYLKFVEGADLLFHDAEYKEDEYKKTRGWGHSLYKDALRLALEGGVGMLGLFHHNQERVDSDVDAIVQDCRKIIQKSGKKLRCFAVGQSMEFTI